MGPEVSILLYDALQMLGQGDWIGRIENVSYLRIDLTLQSFLSVFESEIQYASWIPIPK